MESARRLLEEVGYHDSTVTDITERSGVSLGSFYRYFDNKEELYLLLLQSLVQELYNSVGGVWDAKDVEGSLRRSTMRYLEAYHVNRRLISALQDMAGVVPESARLWWELRLRTFQRMQRFLDNSSDSSDADYVASALGGMVEQFANYWYVQGERHGGKPPPLEEAAVTLARLWYRAVYADKTPKSRRR
jgi:AcrR family transcriptional regulator